MTMINLKVAIIWMMINSSVMPLHNENINNAVNYPAVTGVVNYTVPNEILPRDLAPVQQDASVINTKKEDAPVIQTINKNKTYEQCVKEALEYIYAEVNRLLDKEADQSDEQFWLQNKM